MLYTRKCIGGSNPPLSASAACSSEWDLPSFALRRFLPCAVGCLRHAFSKAVAPSQSGSCRASESSTSNGKSNA